MRFIALVTVFLALSAQAIEPAWEKVGESDGITLYKKEIPDSPVYAYKGMGDLPIPFAKLVSVSRDIPRETEWVDHLDQAKVVHAISPDDRIVYMRFSVPWPFKDRDFLVEAKLAFDRKTRSAIYDIHSVDDFLVREQDCCVRGKVGFEHIVVTPLGDGSRVHVVAEAHIDPKGNIPKWIVNIVQKSFPSRTIEGIAKQVRKPDIQDSPEALEVLHANGHGDVAH